MLDKIFCSFIMCSKIEKLLELLHQSPHDSFLKHALALEYIKIGNDLEAKKLFEDLLAHDPDYTGSYYHLGKLYERICYSEKAIETYEAGIALAKKDKNLRAQNELQSALDELLY